MSKREVIIDNKCGSIVKQVRLQMNCSQEEFGRKIGIDQPTICRIERREKMPTESMLEKITHITDVTVYQLTGQDPINYCRIF